MRLTREYQRGKYHCTVDLLFDWFGISCIPLLNLCPTIPLSLAIGFETLARSQEAVGTLWARGSIFRVRPMRSDPAETGNGNETFHQLRPSRKQGQLADSVGSGSGPKRWRREKSIFEEAIRKSGANVAKLFFLSVDDEEAKWARVFVLG